MGMSFIRRVFIKNFIGWSNHSSVTPTPGRQRNIPQLGAGKIVLHHPLFLAHETPHRYGSHLPTGTSAAMG
jgi:hypothetical protein